MASKPPLSREEAERVLRALAPLSAERRIVLVGGQAVAFWMRFLAPLDTGVLGGQWLTSKDIDFEGSARAVKRAGELIPGRVKLPTMDDHTPNTGLVLFVDSQGIDREIDFIEAPHGLSARDVRETAVEYELEGAAGEESVRFWIMHPERCMESRIVNAVDLGKTDRLAMRQLRASIACSRLWSRYLLDSEQLSEDRRCRTVLNLNERVFRKCLKDRRFRAVVHDHGADPFEAVLVEHPLLPERVRAHRYPQMLKLLDERRRREARNRARAAARARARAGAGN